MLFGSVGYADGRFCDETPVYRLHCETLAIEKIETTGEKPGWISRHRAHLKDESEIYLSGGKVCAMVNGKEVYRDNPNGYVLDLTRMIWRRQ